MNREKHFSEQQTITLEQALGIAVQHHTVGDLSKAKTLYEQILQTNPNHSDALHLLALQTLWHISGMSFRMNYT